MSEENKKEIEYFTEKPPFINRIDEKQYFLNYFNSAPTNILFVYWPKSTWKTTLIYKIINEKLDKEKFDVNFLNLRSVLLRNFSDFKNLFFPESLKWKTKKILWTIWELWAFWLKWNPWEEHILETNIFWVMEDRLRKLNNEWIKPVIILDEFQYLKNIKFDPTLPNSPDNIVVNELFKFFISMTKQFNLCHIVCLTSDSYYMEELYWDTKLANTSRFYLMEHLSKKDIFYWLEDLEKIDKKIVEKIWKNLGWSVWEIWQVLVSYKNTWSYKEELDDLLQVKYSLIAEWYNFYSDKTFSIKVSNEEKEIINYKLENFKRVLEKIVDKWEFIRWKDWIADFELIKELVDKDLWFYDTKQLKITANSKSLEIAFKRLLKELK